MSQHPVEVSSVILLGTALFLSPYLLAGTSWVIQRVLASMIHAPMLHCFS